MGSTTTTGKHECAESPTLSSHVERTRHQRGEEAAVPGLADKGAET